MTISYTGKVANAKLWAFSRLLFYWRGSIYKLMYKEIIIFCTLYALLSVLYRFGLEPPHKEIFERIALYCETFTNLIPLSFVLGFYVAVVVTRWWNQFMSIPWPDRMMTYVTTMIEGSDEHGRLIRRTLMRYLTLASLIVYQATSVSVKKRFPTIDHLLEAGIITQSEVSALEQIQTPHGKWWVPFVWSANLIRQARKEGRIVDEYCMKTLIDELMTYRSSLGLLYSYDWISIPLVYTQVTTLATYTFFIGEIFGRQFLDPEKGYPGHQVDLYVPLFTILQFFFYMGWLKVAEQMINPFGEDDDDFDMNWIIDRNLQVSYLGADCLHGFCPALEKDIYFNEPAPDYLPYTKSSIKSMTPAPMGSTFQVGVSSEGMQLVTNPMETIAEEPQGPAIPNFGSCQTIHNNIGHNVTSKQNGATPMPSPGRSHKITINQNLMLGNGLRNTLNGSQSHCSVGSHPEKGVAAPVAFSLEKARSYMDHWLHEHSFSKSPRSACQSRTDLGSRGGQSLNNVNGISKCDSMIFSIDMEDEAGQKQRPAADEADDTAAGSPPEAGDSVPSAQSGDTPQSVTCEPAPKPAASDPSCDTSQRMLYLAGDPIAIQPTIDEERSRHSSSSATSWEYEKPEPHQTTVTSLTPLLKDMELCSKSDEGGEYDVSIV